MGKDTGKNDEHAILDKAFDQLRTAAHQHLEIATKEHERSEFIRTGQSDELMQSAQLIGILWQQVVTLINIPDYNNLFGGKSENDVLEAQYLIRRYKLDKLTPFEIE